MHALDAKGHQAHAFFRGKIVKQLEHSVQLFGLLRQIGVDGEHRVVAGGGLGSAGLAVFSLDVLAHGAPGGVFIHSTELLDKRGLGVVDPAAVGDAYLAGSHFFDHGAVGVGKNFGIDHAVPTKVRMVSSAILNSGSVQLITALPSRIRMPAGAITP